MKNKKYLWLIDNGHGKNTPGKRSPKWTGYPQLLEYEFTRKVAALLFKMLDIADYDYVQLVPEVRDVSLSERVRRANKQAQINTEKQCIFISIHGNAGPSSASGIEVFTSPGQTKSDQFATILLEKLEKLGWKMRYDNYRDGDPDKEANFYLLRKTLMPAVLSENGFYTNYDECVMMLNPYWQERIAQAHFEAIQEVEINKSI